MFKNFDKFGRDSVVGVLKIIIVKSYEFIVFKLGI